jgi:hypothetical protein
MLVEGYVLVRPEEINENDGAHHVVAGSYETEEQRLVDVGRQCLGCRQTRNEAHVSPYQFIGYDPERIRERLERLRRSGAVLCAGCARKLI